LTRVWNVIVEEERGATGEASPDEVRALERKLHQTILKVTDDIEHFRFNTAVAAMMELNNHLIRTKETPVGATPIWAETARTLVLMMAPIFPHISEELWHRLGNTESVHLQAWPKGDPEKARAEEIPVVVQVNGKVRDKLMVAPGTDSATIESQALALDNVQKWIDGKSIRKVVVVPDKLVNIVVG